MFVFGIFPSKPQKTNEKQGYQKIGNKSFKEEETFESLSDLDKHIVELIERFKKFFNSAIEEKSEDVFEILCKEIVQASSEGLNIMILSPSEKQTSKKKTHAEFLLHYVVKKNYLPGISIMLNLGANPNCEDSSGQTPLFIPETLNHFSINASDIEKIFNCEDDIETAIKIMSNPAEAKKFKHLKKTETSEEAVKFCLAHAFQLSPLHFNKVKTAVERGDKKVNSKNEFLHLMEETIQNSPSLISPINF